MESSSVRKATTAVLIALVIVAIALAFLRPTSEITVDQGPPADFADATALDPVITSLRTDGGFRFLGITFSSPTHRVQVTFIAPPDCAEAIASAVAWPTGIAACAPDGEIAGELSGSGRSRDGDTIVGVTFEVDEDCFDTLETGAVWRFAGACT